MKQVEQNYRSGLLRLIDAPVPRAGGGRNLVATRVSLISAGHREADHRPRALEPGRQGDGAARSRSARRCRRCATRACCRRSQKVFAKLDTPIPLGYSLAGTVVEAGSDAGGYAVGDRIACAGAAVANHAEYNAVPKNLSVRIPAGVDDEAASFVTIGAIALQGVRVANPTLGERVVVMGLGLIGQLTVQLLKANGCRVLGFDPNPARAALALEMGADVAVSAALDDAVRGFTGGYGADAVIVTASSKSSAPPNQAAEISRTKGRVVMVGLTGMEIDREPFYKRELDLRLSMSYGPGRHDPAYEQEGHDYPLAYVRWTEQRNMQAFLELVADGRVTPLKLVTHRFPIARGRGGLQVDGRRRAVPRDPADLSRHADARSRGRSRSRARRRRAGARGTGFIGFGNYAKAVLLPALKKAGNERLTTVVTSTGLSAHDAAERQGFAHAATDPQAVLGDRRDRLRVHRDAPRQPCAARGRGAQGGQARVRRKAARADPRPARRGRKRPPKLRRAC